MRGMAYVIAALAAVGIMIGIASLPNGQTDTPEDDSSVASQSPDVTAVARVMDEPGELKLSVPGMHCEYSCFPRIKETLESTDAVNTVALAEQKEEGVLDNKTVIVKYDAGFNLDAAIASLVQEGFEKSDVVQ